MSTRDDRNRDHNEHRRRRDRDDRETHRRRDRDNDRDRDTEGDSRQKQPIPGPVILLKRPNTCSVTSSGPSPSPQTQTPVKDKNPISSDSRPTSILQRSILPKRHTDNNKDATSSQHTDNSDNSQKTKQPPPLSLCEILKPLEFPHENAVTVIDKNMNMKPLKDFEILTNGKIQTDFFVITAVGKRMTGKSTVLSFLSNEKVFGTNTVFGKRTRNQEMESFMYINSDNVILIELASLFNCASAHDLASQQGTLETASLTWNLRLMRWALAISHVVLVVSDNIIDPNVLNLINSAEIIRSMESALGDGVYPEILYVCNKAPLSYLDNVKAHSEFQFLFTTMTGRNPRIQPNFFVLPHLKWDNDWFRYDIFRAKLKEFGRYNRCPFLPEIENIPKIPQKHSAAEWYSNSLKLWEEMNHPTFFLSYVKLLP